MANANISESGSDEVKPNVAYSIPGTTNNIDDIKLEPNMAYSKASISGTACSIDDVRLQPCMAYGKASISGTAYDIDGEKSNVVYGKDSISGTGYVKSNVA